MPFQLPNAVHETTTTSGTGSLTLLGAVTDRKTFGSQLANGDTTMFVTTDGTDWECAIGTFTGPSTISRDTVIYSTNGNALVNWPGSGTRDVYVAPPGEAFASLIDPGMAAGLLCKAADRTYTARSIDVDTDDLQVANPTGAAGNPTLALAFTVSTFIKTLLDDANADAAKATLEVADPIIFGAANGTVTNVTFALYRGIYGGSDSGSSLTSQFEHVVPRAGVISGFRCKAGLNAIDGDTVVTVYLNGSPTNITVTIPAGSTAVVADLAHSITVAAGDVLSVEIDGTAGTTGSIQGMSWSAVYGYA